MCQSKADGGRRCASSEYAVSKARREIPAPEKIITGDTTSSSTEYEKLASEYISSLTDEERNAVAEYVNQAYEDINRELWSGDDTNELIAHLDSALAKGNPETLTVHRKPAFPRDITRDEQKEIAKKFTTVGNIIDSKGYMSTSANPNAIIPLLHQDITPSRWVNEEFIRENDMTHQNIVFEIITNQGRPVSPLSHMPQEKEYLLPRNTQWKIIRVTPGVEFSTQKNLATGEAEPERKRTATIVQLVEL